MLRLIPFICLNTGHFFKMVEKGQTTHSDSPYEELQLCPSNGLCRAYNMRMPCLILKFTQQLRTKGSPHRLAHDVLCITARCSSLMPLHSSVKQRTVVQPPTMKLPSSSTTLLLPAARLPPKRPRACDGYHDPQCGTIPACLCSLFLNYFLDRRQPLQVANASLRVRMFGCWSFVLAIGSHYLYK